MSDTSADQSALDPKRPWIEDESQLPSKMNWFGTFFNPAGESPKLHFTRAWTALFFTQFLVYFGIGIMLLGIAGMLGADMSGARVAFTYFVAAVFVVTTFFSFIIHARRLNNANRASAWALIVLIPLIVAMAQFTFGVMGSAQTYQEKYDARAEYIADPITWEAKHLEVRREEQAAEKKRQEEAKANEDAREDPMQCLADAKEAKRVAEEAAKAENEKAEEESDEPKFDDNADKPLASMEAFVLRPNAAAIPGTIILLSFPIMLWSLLWVARTRINGVTYEAKGMNAILFSLRGRIGRLSYLGGFALTLVITGGAYIVATIIGGIVPPIAPFALIPVAILFLFLMIALTSKRLHDLGQPMWRMLLPWAAMIFALLIVVVMSILNGPAIELAEYNCGDNPMAVTIGQGAAAAIVAGAHIGFFLWMCLGWPEMRDNKYGPAPIPGETGPQYPEGYVPGKRETDLFA